jgi:hypothetical protein
MTDLLIVVSVLLFVALIIVSIDLRQLRHSIPDLVDEGVDEGVDAAIKEFRKRSGRTRVGTTVEQMVPFVKEMPYEPSDMRILSGGPVDYVVFDGLCEGKVRELVFLDVKTGKARTNEAQKQVQACADLGRVRFAVFEIDGSGNARAKPSKRVDEVLEFIDDETRARLRLPE